MEKTSYHLYRPLLTLDLVSPLVFRGSLNLVGFSVSLMFPLVIPLVFPHVFFVFFAGSAPFMKDRPLGFPPYIILVSVHPTIIPMYTRAYAIGH